MTTDTDTFAQPGRTPMAPAVGPFPRPPFIEAVTGFRGESYTYLGDEDGVLAVTINDGVVRTAGHPDLTDYHSPLGDRLEGVAESLAERVRDGMSLDLDSFPEEVSSPLVDALRAEGLEVDVSQHEVSAVVFLPDSFEDYLGMLSKKQRHEVRRKRRRYEDVLGSVVHEVHRGSGWAFDEFIRLHRLADGEKGDFMTPDRETFFRALADTEGWRVDVLRVPHTDRAAAALFAYSDDEGIYLYNSSYDPGLSDASPGIAIVGTLAEQAIEEGLPRFDFLKGDETYKFRLGAEERPLFRIEVSA